MLLGSNLRYHHHTYPGNGIYRFDTCLNITAQNKGKSVSLYITVYITSLHHVSYIGRNRRTQAQGYVKSYQRWLTLCIHEASTHVYYNTSLYIHYHTIITSIQEQCLYLSIHHTITLPCGSQGKGLIGERPLLVKGH